MGLFDMKPKTYTAEAGHRPVQCLHCGEGEFWERRAKLNSAASEFFDVAWASEESSILTCTTCGYRMEFLPRGLTLTRLA